MDQTSTLPFYTCHKRVQAVKISYIRNHKLHEEWKDVQTSMTLVPVEELRPFEISKEYVRRHNPQPGGYYVRYEDGYESYSPAEPFESGYIRERDYHKKAMESAIVDLRKEAWQAWEEENKYHVSGINPYAFVAGYLKAARKRKDLLQPINTQVGGPVFPELQGMVEHMKMVDLNQPQSHLEKKLEQLDKLHMLPGIEAVMDKEEMKGKKDYEIDKHKRLQLLIDTLINVERYGSAQANWQPSESFICEVKELFHIVPRKFSLNESLVLDKYIGYNFSISEEVQHEKRHVASSERSEIPMQEEIDVPKTLRSIKKENDYFTQHLQEELKNNRYTMPPGVDIEEMLTDREEDLKESLVKDAVDAMTFGMRGSVGTSRINEVSEEQKEMQVKVDKSNALQKEFEEHSTEESERVIDLSTYQEKTIGWWINGIEDKEIKKKWLSALLKSKQGYSSMLTSFKKTRTEALLGPFLWDESQDGDDDWRALYNEWK